MDTIADAGRQLRAVKSGSTMMAASTRDLPFEPSRPTTETSRPPTDHDDSERCRQPGGVLDHVTSVPTDPL